MFGIFAVPLRGERQDGCEERDKEYTFDSGIGVDEGPCESRTPVSSMETGKM